MKVGIETSFSAAHSLPGHVSCGQVHGHNYRVRVTVDYNWLGSGEPPEEVDEVIVLDFSLLTRIVGDIIKPWDHTNLNGMFEWPTAEELAGTIAYKTGVKLANIWCEREEVELVVVTARVWETDKYFAEDTWGPPDFVPMERAK